jgi:hypothetical protein
MNPFAAIYAFWLGIPAPMRAAITASTLSVNTALGSVVIYAAGQGALNHGTASFLAWVSDNWLSAIFTALYGGTVSSTIRAAKSGTYAPAPAPPPTPPQETKP